MRPWPDGGGNGREIRGVLGDLGDGAVAGLEPFPEKVVHIAAMGGVPAVLGAEATHPAVKQGFVQLVFQRCSPE